MLVIFKFREIGHERIAINRTVQTSPDIVFAIDKLMKNANGIVRARNLTPYSAVMLTNKAIIDPVNDMVMVQSSNHFISEEAVYTGIKVPHV